MNSGRSADEMNPRTCIVTRQALDATDLLRFVADPGGRIVPDLKRKLPGRGVWVTARRDMVDEAVRKRAFARGLKAEVSAASDLGAEVDRLLERDALAALSMAAKAGLVRFGAFKVDRAVRAGQAVLVLHASDAAPDGVRKLDQAVHATREAGGENVAVASPFTSVQMDLALGGDNVIHAAAIEGGAARVLVERILRLQRYRAE
ncbi:MAG: RNA-binding protein [Pseudomonadota bacterium]|nr:RNA-binding protein [Pseudomonadota bacterium]